jgi:galactokinase
MIAFVFSEERFKRLVEKFKEVYPGVQPQFLCRAPGRVNLIGNIKFEVLCI